MRLGLKRDDIRLVEYTPKWKEEFEQVKQAILQSTPIPENRIEHIGSTAIKGMVAKPILDVIVGVDDIDDVNESIFEGFKEIGFLRLRVHGPNEIVLAKFSDDTYEEKTHFIHLVDYDEKLWKDLIFFRDYLNTNESARVKYSSLKKEFLKEHKGGIKAYTDYKEPFVKGIFRKRK